MLMPASSWRNQQWSQQNYMRYVSLIDALITLIDY